jgi:hypothetical protein
VTRTAARLGRVAPANLSPIRVRGSGRLEPPVHELVVTAARTPCGSRGQPVLLPQVAGLDRRDGHAGYVCAVARCSPERV